MESPREAFSRPDNAQALEEKNDRNREGNEGEEKKLHLLTSHNPMKYICIVER